MSSRWFALVRSALFAPLFVALWSWLIPGWIAAARHVPLALHPSPLALALMAAGALVMLRCVFDFAWSGRGTPAPFDPPRRLVVRGLYRWVRNPMYVGMGLFLVGEALALPAIRRELLAVAAAAWALATAFIRVYEEPTLRRSFGADYAEYCRHVRRWLPPLVTAFIRVYEEPTLRRSFGADYAEYCRHVRRWLPRLRPFVPGR
jgi:protein-S-isoprenylcysteine O-methyltransferase Ste14